MDIEHSYGAKVNIGSLADRLHHVASLTGQSVKLHILAARPYP